MITRWQYYLIVAMITRWHYVLHQCSAECISVEIVIGWIHWTVNLSNCKHQWTVHCVRSLEWSTFHLHLCIVQKPSPKCHFTYIFAIFISLWGSTHDSADCWSAHRYSAARDSFKRVHGPQQKSWLRRCSCSDKHRRLRWSRALRHSLALSRHPCIGACIHDDQFVLLFAKSEMIGNRIPRLCNRRPTAKTTNANDFARW